MFYYRTLFISLLFFGTLTSFLQGQEEQKRVEVEKKEAPLSAPSPLNPSMTELELPKNPFEEIVVQETQESNDHFMEQFIHMLTVLGFIIALIFLVSWLLKRMLNTRIQQVNTTSDIKILERRALSPKTTIYILDIQGLKVAIAESPTGATLLGPIKNEEEFDEKETPISDFQQILKNKSNPTP